MIVLHFRPLAFLLASLSFSLPVASYTAAAANHDYPESLLSASKMVVRRGLKMGMKSKKSPKSYDDDALDLDSDDDAALNSTAAPAVSLVPSAPPLKSSKKKGKKKKKSEKSSKSKKSKKKKKKKSSKKASGAPSASPSPVFIPSVNQTSAPVVMSVPTNAPMMAPSIPSNATEAPISVVTMPPSVASKSKKSKKGKGGKGKGGMDSREYRSRGGLPTVSPAPSYTFNPSAATSLSDTAETLTPSTSQKPRPSQRSKSTPVPGKADAEDDAEAATSPDPTSSLLQIPLSQFQVSYNVVATAPVSTENIMEVVDITFLFINNYLTTSFGVGNQITYESLIGFHTAHSSDFQTIQFMATAQFYEPSDATTFVPNSSDLDLLLQRAFEEPIVQTLLILLHSLPTTNPYSQATEAQYALVAAPTSAPSGITQTSDSGNAVATTAGIAGALLVACFITGMVAFYRWGTFDKMLAKKKQPKYAKASVKEASYAKASVIEASLKQREITRKGSKTKQRETARNVSKDDDDDSYALDWTSSVGSVPPSSNSSDVEDTGYQSRVIDEDMEIKFIYPADGGMQYDPSIHDPLFPQSPSTSEEENGRKKRHNI